jgi:hypothetical protein
VLGSAPSSGSLVSSGTFDDRDVVSEFETDEENVANRRIKSLIKTSGGSETEFRSEDEGKSESTSSDEQEEQESSDSDSSFKLSINERYAREKEKRKIANVCRCCTKVTVLRKK